MHGRTRPLVMPSDEGRLVRLCPVPVLPQVMTPGQSRATAADDLAARAAALRAAGKGRPRRKTLMQLGSNSQVEFCGD
jgi:hypothetical protein